MGPRIYEYESATITIFRISIAETFDVNFFMGMELRVYYACSSSATIIFFLFQANSTLNFIILYKITNLLQYILRCDLKLGPVVQIIVSLRNSLGGQLVTCFTTLYPNTLIFFFAKK